MRIEEVIRCLRSGARLKKSYWGNGQYIQEQNNTIVSEDGKPYDLHVFLHEVDWVMVKPKTGLYKDKEGDWSIFDGNKWYLWEEDYFNELCDGYYEQYSPKLVEECVVDSSCALVFKPKIIFEGEQ